MESMITAIPPENENNNKSENDKISKIMNYKYYAIEESTGLIKEISVKEQLEKFTRIFHLEESLNDLKSQIQSQNISIGSFSCFQHYEKYFNNSDKKKGRYQLISALYSNLKNIKPQKPHPPLEVIEACIIIDKSTFNKIIEMIILGLSFFMDNWFNEKQFNLVFEERSWKVATKSKEVHLFFEEIKMIKTIKILLSPYIDEENYLDKILLFNSFFFCIFPSLLVIEFNMNITKLNHLYLDDKVKRSLYYVNNFYNINKLSQSYNKNLIANYLISQKITQLANKTQLFITLELYDSYIIEVEQLLQKELELKNLYSYQINLLYYLCYFEPTSFFEFSFKINGLDTVLFNNILMIFYKAISIEPLSKTEIDLFPEKMENRINYRKIYLNKLYYQNTNRQKGFNKEYQEFIDRNLNFKIENNYNWNNTRDIITISDESILDILFNDFNENLLILITLLEKNKQMFKHLKIRLVLPEVLKSKFCYQSAVSLFIYNCFLMLNRKSGNKIEINYLNIETNAILTRYIQKNKGKINLNEMYFQNCFLSIPNISKYIDFSTFPFSTISFLGLANLSYDDLIEIDNGLKIKLPNIKKLRDIRINMQYEYNINFDSIYLFFKECIPQSVSEIFFSIPQELGYDELTLGISSIVKGLAFTQTIDKKLKVHVNFCYKFSNKEFCFKNFRDIIEKCFDFSCLSEEYLTTYKFKKFDGEGSKVFREIELQIIKIKLIDSIYPIIQHARDNFMGNVSEFLQMRISTLILSYFEELEQVITIYIIIDKNGEGFTLEIS